MIGHLQGMLAEKNPPFLLLDVAGVGYELEAPMSTFYQLPEPGHPVKLITHLVVREDSHTLYGFCSKRERLLFRHLIKVNGIGPRLAITILSTLDYDQFVSAIGNKNLPTLTQIPGIGKKTAERLLLEMQDKLKAEIAAREGQADGNTREKSEPHQQNPRQNIQETKQALLALGYKAHEADKALTNIESKIQPATSTEEMIRLALQNMH